MSPTHYFPPEIIGLLMGRDDIELPSDVPRPDPSSLYFIYCFVLLMLHDCLIALLQRILFTNWMKETKTF